MTDAEFGIHVLKIVADEVSLSAYETIMLCK